MPRSPSLPRRKSRGRRGAARTERRKTWREKVEATIVTLWRRVDKLENRKRWIGFQTTDARGDGIEQEWSDEEEIPEET